MFPSIWFIFLIFVVTLSTKDCANYYEGPIDVALNKDIGTMEMLETLEISFDLKINAECFTTEFTWCHLFAIGGRLPLLYTWSGEFVANFGDGGCCYDCIREFYTTMIDGKYHKFHLKYTPTERIITFDDLQYNYTKEDDAHNNIIPYAHRSYSISTVWGSSVQHATNATIKHLCINPRHKSPNDISTTMQTNITNTDTVTTSTEHAVTYNSLPMSTVSDLSTTEDYNGDETRSNIDIPLFIVALVIVVLCSVGVRDCTRYKGCNDAQNESEVSQWLTAIGLGCYLDAFRRNGLTSLQCIRQIKDEDDLKSIGIDLKGHRIVIMSAIEKLNTLNQTENGEVDMRIEEGMPLDTYVKLMTTSGEHSEIKS